MAVDASYCEDDGIVRISVRCPPSEDDYRRVLDCVEDAAAVRESLRIMVTVRPGEEPADTVPSPWLRVGRRLDYLARCDRLAIVAKIASDGWIAGFLRPFTGATVGYFDPVEVDSAITWLKSQ